MSVNADDAATAVDSILTRVGLPVSEDERKRLVTFYPLVRSWMERVRLVEARYADPALVYPAAPHD